MGWKGQRCQNSLLQSLPTTRKQKLCCTMPRDGCFEGYLPEQLVELETEIYGLVSGPAWWRMRKSFLKVLVTEGGYRINPFDRCVLTLDSDDRSACSKTQGIIVIEVDEVLESGNGEHRRRMDWLETRLKFGKAVNLQTEVRGTGYDGRRLKQCADFSFEITMDDCVQNRLKPLAFERKFLIKNSKDVKFTEKGEAAMRRTVASINWHGKEGQMLQQLHQF